MPDEDGALAVEDGSGGVVGLGVVAVGLGVVAVGLGVVGVGTVPNLGKESNERYPENASVGSTIPYVPLP